jgi:hypothetical protein
MSILKASTTFIDISKATVVVPALLDLCLRLLSVLLSLDVVLPFILYPFEKVNTTLDV